jgi:hypothetical protein
MIPAGGGWLRRQGRLADDTGREGLVEETGEGQVEETRKREGID